MLITHESFIFLFFTVYRTIVIARVEQTEIGTPLVDVEKIRNTLAANGVGIIGGADTANGSMTYFETTTKLPINGIIPDGGDSAGTSVNKTISNVHEEVVSRQLSTLVNFIA